MKTVRSWVVVRLGCLSLTGELRDLDNNEFRRLQRRKGDYDIDDAVVNIGLCRRLVVALYLERLARCVALKGPLAEQAKHKGFNRRANRGPQRLVIRLEDHPTQIVIQ